ncbi:hypothetical protein [Delftia phage PhiW-14]|uniref:Uncharacterized protein n=1 Tax=Delftia phage PhiW-14 TaxID=665032 RepID=C9DGF1_BPW14|nr:hypothetical protein DP-phiW-14_gp181 [Delftia phage PhiW-14]ACV50202.1 hypothetical protein [Delftia phage PhiW-14]
MNIEQINAEYRAKGYSSTAITVVAVDEERMEIRKDETATMLASLYILTPDGLIRGKHDNRKLGKNAMSLRQSVYNAARIAGFKFKANYDNK